MLRSLRKVLADSISIFGSRPASTRPARYRGFAFRGGERLEDRSMMAVLYWDTNGATPGLGGAGTWSTSAANWTTDPAGAIATQAWNNSAGDTAVFSGTGGAITLPANINAAQVQFTGNGYNVSGSTLTLTGAATVNVASGVSAVVSTKLQGSAGFDKTGAGTVTLGGINTFTGGSNIIAGTVIMHQDKALGNSSITLSGGKLQAGNGQRVLSNSIIAASGTTSDFNALANNFILNGNLSGSGTLRKVGTSSVYLGGNNANFAGTFTNTQGNVYLTAANSGSAQATWNISGGDLLALSFSGDGTVQFGALSGSSGRVVSSILDGSKTVEIGALNTTTTYSGTIQNHTTTTTATVVNVVKVGSGALTLGGQNTFTGNLTIDAGTLTLASTVNDGTSKAGKGTITVAPDATLRVTGYNVFGTGTNRPSELTLGAGSTLALVGAAYAQLPHVTMNGAAITSGAGNASYGSAAFFGGISAAGTAASTITGQNMYLPASVAIDIAAGSVLEMTANFDNTPGYGDSTITETGTGNLVRFGNLVVNGSFEQPDVTAGTFSLLTSIPGWSLLRGDRFEIQDNISNLGGASDGQQHLELDSNTTSSDVQQTIAVIPGAVYSVSFDYRGRPNRSSSDNQLKFEAYDSDNVLILEESITATNTSSWTTWTGSFTAPTSAVRLVFKDTGTPNSYGAFVDDVQLESQSEINLIVNDLEDPEEESPGHSELVAKTVFVELETNYLPYGSNLKIEFPLNWTVADSDRNAVLNGAVVSSDIRGFFVTSLDISSGLLKVSYFKDDPYDPVATDQVKISFYDLDLGVDSNNDSILDLTRNGDDDAVEENFPGMEMVYQSSTLYPMKLSLLGYTPNSISTTYVSVFVENPNVMTIWEDETKANEIVLDINNRFSVALTDLETPITYWLESLDYGICKIVASIDSNDSYADGQGLSDTVFVSLMNKGPILSTKFVKPEDLNLNDIADKANYGKLETGTNPNGTADNNSQNSAITIPQFKGGDRFFPDALVGNINVGRNIVRVRTEVTGVPEGTPVYFRAFDVDDPSSDLIIDPNDAKVEDSGGDNRGRIGTGTALHNPVASISLNVNTKNGYNGRLRSVNFVNNKETAGEWKVDGEVVEALVKKIQINGADHFVAEVDLLTTFAPGDNFRVVASLNDGGLKNADPGKLKTDGDFPGVTPQLAIWRHLHVEDDAGSDIYKLMQAVGDNRQKNRFADAYIQPEYTDLTGGLNNKPNAFTMTIAADGKIDEIAFQTLPPFMNQNVYINGKESPKYWVVYATDLVKLGNPGANLIRDGIHLGYTLNNKHLGYTFQASYIFRESVAIVVDESIADPNARPAAVDAIIARVTVHEIAHQLLQVNNLDRNGHRGSSKKLLEYFVSAQQSDKTWAKDINIMNVEGHSVPESNNLNKQTANNGNTGSIDRFYFYSSDIVTMRAVFTSPGKN